MNFRELLLWKARVRAERPAVVDVSEMRIALAFRDIRPVVTPLRSKKLHRCDLARTWCEARGLTCLLRQRALVCEGVRHALRLLLRILTEAGSRVAIPRDVYPVYWEIAAEAGAVPLSIDTFPELDLAATLHGCAVAGVSLVLLPCPLKLQGRRWTAGDAATAAAWLHEDPRRRLILDGVYSLGGRLDDATRALIENDQVFYLDSLSKGWLHENVFGAAVVPERDISVYANAFRQLEIQQEHLHVANELLTRFSGLPEQLAHAIAVRRVTLHGQLRAAGIPFRSVSHGYLTVIEDSAERVLEKHDVLAIPVSVFGSPVLERCIASALRAPDAL